MGPMANHWLVQSVHNWFFHALSFVWCWLDWVCIEGADTVIFIFLTVVSLYGAMTAHLLVYLSLQMYSDQIGVPLEAQNVLSQQDSLVLTVVGINRRAVYSYICLSDLCWPPWIHHSQFTILLMCLHVSWWSHLSTMGLTRGPICIVPAKCFVLTS